MSDLVSRLRDLAGRFGTTSTEARDLMREAADEIERLTATRVDTDTN